MAKSLIIRNGSPKNKKSIIPADINEDPTVKDPSRTFHADRTVFIDDYGNLKKKPLKFQLDEQRFVRKGSSIIPMKPNPTKMQEFDPYKKMPQFKKTIKRK